MPMSHAAGEPQLPTLLGTCPQMTANGTYMFGNSMSTRMMPVVIYIDPAAKAKPAPGGPLILYFHATGGQPSEVQRGFGDTAIQQVTAAGGVVASFTTTACAGCATTDDLVWWAEDDYVQDDVVACAVQQAKIDTHRIHALGWSAGALHSTHVALARSNYIASIISYSGGSYILPPPIQDPNNHVASIMSYGAQGVDSVILDFHLTSVDWYNTYQPKGYYTMMCDHEMGHMIPSDLAPKAYEFFIAHPFEVSPEPYASSVPSGYPAYCKNMP
jgi:predicted esterase